jgi:hypothetical protein
MTRCWLALALLLSACGTDSNPDPAPADEWQPLVAGSWNLAPGAEGYTCVYATIAKDTDIDALRPLLPDGTHHAVLTLYDGSEADGTRPCSVSTNGRTMIYGFGIGSPEFAFPAGVGLHLAKGTRLLLNLHLYNAHDTELSGTSGMDAHAADPASIQHTAEVVLAGPTAGLTVPTGTSTQTGTCAVSNFSAQPIQVFAVSQHMHRLGTHLKTTVARGTDTFVLQDEPYSFERQLFHLVEPAVELRPGDVVTTACTYDNPGPVVRFGDSSDDEMCFSDLYFYPGGSFTFVCTNS